MYFTILHYTLQLVEFTVKEVFIIYLFLNRVLLFSEKNILEERQVVQRMPQTTDPTGRK